MESFFGGDYLDRASFAKGETRLVGFGEVICHGIRSQAHGEVLLHIVSVFALILGASVRVGGR
jgi:hypothetical protein